MNELPERIMAWGHFGDDSVTGQWSSNTYHNDNVVEYVRADLVAELVEALEYSLSCAGLSYIGNDFGHEFKDEMATLSKFKDTKCE